MKFSTKYIFILSILILTGCYQSNDNAKVRINLGNLHAVQGIPEKSFLDKVMQIFYREAYAQAAPGDLMTVHFGIYTGRTLIEKRSINIADIPSSQIIEIEVPAGDDRTVLVIGENTSNQAGYFGFNNVNLKAGETADVTVKLTVAQWDGISLDENGVPREVTSTPNCGPAPYTITWTHAGLKAVRYLIIDTSPVPEEIKYSGYDTEYNDNSSNNYWFYVEFEDFNLRTPGYSVNNC
jgi:hypothetical protein